LIPAIALTAGLGSRLDPLTRLVAKPAVPLGDSTLIEPGVTIAHCVVAGPVTLPSGFAAQHSVIVPASVLRPGDPVTATGDVAVFPLR
jgi:hypothetical protein